LKQTLPFRISRLPYIFKKSGVAWFDSDPFKLSAIVAYYAILSFPALLIIILNLVGAVWGREIVQGEVLDQISSAVGTETAESIRLMILNNGDKPTSIFSSVVGVITLLYGSTGVFFALQNAIDDIWGSVSVHKNNIISMLIKRSKSFGFILIIGFLLLISFVLTSLLSIFSKRIERFVPDELFEYVYLFDIIISLGVIYTLFAALFKFLPNVNIPWRAVRFGAAVTSILFVLGKYLLAIYFNQAEPGSTYGAAGSIILIMLWVSYSSLILFYGAHFTKVYADVFLLEETPESEVDLP